VTKPGDRQAMPTSWMSRAVIGLPRLLLLAFLLGVSLDKSRRCGLCLGLCGSGERGSFLTRILGVVP
jgi:hypothetical protein